VSGKRQRYRTSLRITEGPGRRWWKEDYDIKPAKAARYGGKWSEQEVRYVILNPTLTFDEIGEELRRGPGPVNALRSIIRVVAGATSNAGGWVKENSHRAQLVRKVLDDLQFDSWTEEEVRRYIVRGRGRRSDKTQKAELIRRGREGQRSKRK
jgi:hypothetical protein